MTKYGKIYIEANTIEEAERDLAMIKALAGMGAVSGKGSSVLGMATAETVGKPSVRTKCDCCCGCGCECCGGYKDEDEDDDFYDDYEDEDEEEELTAEERLMEIISDIEDGTISPKYGAMLISEIICGEWGE